MVPVHTVVCTLILITACGYSQSGFKNYSSDLRILLDTLSTTRGEIYIQIDKSDYILSIMADSLVIKQYPVVFGGNPVDDKLRQGDQCTPEGRFRVRAKYHFFMKKLNEILTLST